MMYGFTDNYIKVEIPFDERLVNLTSEAKLLSLHPDLHMKGQSLFKATSMLH